MLTRRCNKCGLVKPLNKFSKSADCTLGRTRQCKTCKHKYIRQWQIDNPDKRKRTARKWYGRNKERMSIEGKKKYQTNKEKIKAAVQRYSITLKGKAVQLKSAAKYRNSTKGKIRKASDSAKYRGLLATCRNDLTAEQWQSILDKHNYSCAYCGRRFTEDCGATMDHVIPLSEGGEHTACNIVPACQSCNSRKHNKWALVPA